MATDGLIVGYFLLAAARRWLGHLDKAVVAVLAFIGLKMLLEVASQFLAGSSNPSLAAFAHYIHIPALLNLAIVAALLAGGVAASLIWPVKEHGA